MYDSYGDDRPNGLMRLANAALAGAVALPIITTFMGIGPARAAGALTFYLAVGAAITVGGIGSYAKNLSPAQQAAIRLACAGLLLIFGAVSVARQARDAKVLEQARTHMKESLRESTATALGAPLKSAPRAAVDTSGASDEARRMVALQGAVAASVRKQAVLIGAWEKRVQALSFDNIIAPSTLTSRQRIGESRATIARYRALLDERDQIHAQGKKDAEQTINSLELDAAERRDALAGMREGRRNATAVMSKHAAIQRDAATKVEQVLDFAEPRLGKIKLVNNDLEFATQADLDLYRKLAQAVADAGAREEQSVQELLKFQQRSVDNFGK